MMKRKRNCTKGIKKREPLKLGDKMKEHLKVERN